MHSMMEGEGGSEPQDVFVELGTLIIEGRVPGVSNPRGYSEGPHCSNHGVLNTTSRHLCNPQQNFLCKRAENFRKHMLLMFQNNIPMCIEVLLCSECACGAQKAQSPEVGIVPSASDILLEQWTITYMSRTNEPATMLVRGLVQAVRSQLHFSQLSAWWSSSKGIHPSHVNYRITVPGQAFSSQFSRQPNEHAFPLASVGKNGAIKVCSRSLPRMDLVPVIHCPLHSVCVTPLAEGGEKPGLPKTFLLGTTSSLDSACGTSAGAGLDGAGDSMLGESLLDPPQRFRSPPRATEAPDRFLPKGFASEVVGARWPTDKPPSPTLGLAGRMWMLDGNRPCMGSSVSGQVCPRAAASSRKNVNDAGQENIGEISGILDDRMQMKCNMPGKHHCSCEVEEEIEEIKSPAPAQVRQRRRSQASMTSHPVQPLSSVSDALDTLLPSGCNASEGVANESTKRSSGLAVTADEYLYTSDGVSGMCGNTGSLKRRRPVLDTAEASCSTFQPKSWMDADSDHDSAVGACAGNGISFASSSGTTGVSSPFGVSPSKGSTASSQLKPPLSKHELEEVLAVLRDRNKPNSRSNFQTQQVFFTSDSAKGKDLVEKNCEMSDGCYPLFRPNLNAEIDLKSSKTDSCMDAAMHPVGKVCQHSTVYQSPCLHCRRERIDLLRAMYCAKVESHCDKIWSDIKNRSSVINSVKPKCHPNCVISGKKTSNDLSEDHKNQVICDKHTSLLKCDIGDSYLCLSCVSETLSSQTKENQPQTLNSMQQMSPKNCGVPSPPRLLQARSRKENCSSASLAVKCVTQEMQKEFQNGFTSRQDVPSASERERFRRSFDSAASMVFHTRTGLPLTSSPAPVRRGTSHFDYDSSLNSVSAIRSALFDTPTIATQMEDSLNLSSDDTESESGARSPCSPDAGISFPSLGPCHALSPCSSLLGSFEESVLNGRLEPVSTVQGFTAEIGASGSFCPRHLKLPVTVFFYTLGDYDKVSTPYLGHINLGKKGYNVPRSGTIQVTLFNPMETVIKMFVVMYDLNDMPPNSHTFLRQRTLYMPTETEVLDDLPDSDLTQKWLRYLIHLRFSSSKSGRIYLHTDVRMIIFRKSDMDTATVHNNNNVDSGFELRSYTYGPGNPKFSPR